MRSLISNWLHLGKPSTCRHLLSWWRVSSEWFTRCNLGAFRASHLNKSRGSHLPPFLYVSGQLYKTAQGIIETIKRRKLSVGVYNSTLDLTTSFRLQDNDFRSTRTNSRDTRKTKSRKFSQAFADKDIPY